MKITIFNNETVQEVMDQLRFVLMELGVVLDVVEADHESTIYELVPARPLDKE